MLEEGPVATGNEPVIFDLAQGDFVRADVNSGSAGSSPRMAGVFQDRYFVFQASDGGAAAGTEFWYWDVETFRTESPKVLDSQTGTDGLEGRVGPIALYNPFNIVQRSGNNAFPFDAYHVRAQEGSPGALSVVSSAVISSFIDIPTFPRTLDDKPILRRPQSTIAAGFQGNNIMLIPFDDKLVRGDIETVSAL